MALESKKMVKERGCKGLGHLEMVATVKSGGTRKMIMSKNEMRVPDFG